MSKQAVLFDWNATLVNDLQMMYGALCYVFQKSGKEPPDFVTFCQTWSSPSSRCYERYGITSPEAPSWYWERHKERPLFDDVVPTVKKLAGRGIVVGIVSTHFKEKILASCKEAGIASLIADIAGEKAEKVRSIRSFRKRYRVDERNTLYVGDFISDMRDAKLAGVVAVGITRGNPTEQALIAAGADHVIQHLPELIELL